MDKRETCKPQNASSSIDYFREMQTNEAQRCTNSLQQNFKREKHKIENANSQYEFR
jgi:hypothetical protein